MSKTIQIGNGAGFWGDNIDAPVALVNSSQLDYLTLEYLAELTMSILAHQKSKRPDAGFVTDVPLVVGSIIDALKDQTKLKFVTNGGGMNPTACAVSVASVLVENGLGDDRIAACQGDDIKDRLSELVTAGETFTNIETGEPLGDRINIVASANAYLGAAGIVEALENGARFVLTGRIADASLVTGPAIKEFDWDFMNDQAIANATVAGHLIECGAQVSGGIFSQWDPEHPIDLVSYPIAEINSAGESIIQIPPGTQGVVNTQTVAEQLVYEIGDPAAYMTPDVIADFTQVTLDQIETNKVSVKGGMGHGAPERYKVSLAYYDGFAVSGTIVLCGPDAERNARASANMIRERVRRAGFDLKRFSAEVLGTGDSMPGIGNRWSAANSSHRPWEVVLRIAAQDPNKKALDRLARELAPLVTSGPPAVTGYTGARMRPHPVLRYWPTTISREMLEHHVTVKAAKEWMESTHE